MKEKLRLVTYLMGVIGLIMLLIGNLNTSDTLAALGLVLLIIAAILYGAEKFVFRK